MALTRETGMPKASKGTTDITNLDEKEYDLRLVYVADLGTQDTGFPDDDGNRQYTRQGALMVEVCGETIILNDEEKARSLWLKPFKMYETMMGKYELAFYKVFVPTATKDDTPDWEAQLGKPCSGMVINVEGKGKNAGKVFDNLANLSSIPEKYQADIPPATIEPAIGDADDPNNVVTKSLWGLPKYVYDKRIGAAPPEQDKGNEGDVPY